jgi:hypothetical protein
MVETKGTERDMIISKREKRTIVYNLKWNANGTSLS